MRLCVVWVQVDQSVAGLCELCDRHPAVLAHVLRHLLQLVHRDVDELAAVVNYTGQLTFGLQVLHSLNHILKYNDVKERMFI